MKTAKRPTTIDPSSKCFTINCKNTPTVSAKKLFGDGKILYFCDCCKPDPANRPEALKSLPFCYEVKPLPKTMAQLRQEAKVAPKYVLYTNEFGFDMYVADADKIDMPITDNVKEALWFSVGFDNPDMKLAGWKARTGYKELRVVVLDAIIEGDFGNGPEVLFTQKAQ